FHKLTQSVKLTTREKRDVSPSENAGLQVLPQALTRDPNQLLTWLQASGDRLRKVSNPGTRQPMRLKPCF
ncbi:MAG: hypothetical protein J5492_03385, partial [Oxalobacter sp.]|nr:hypothetical protein [Oxalobacter sp.]